MDKVVRVNMTELTSGIEPVPAEWIGLGGRALTSTIVTSEVPPACHALGAGNKLVFAPGLLSGTAALGSGRVSVGAKSPLTGGIREANAGGMAATMLARLGIKALIVEGLPEDDKWYSLHVSKNAITINEESELIGEGNVALINRVRTRYGLAVGVMSIGPVGEMKMLSAAISVTDAEARIRSIGQGGLGAVMGAKKIKFILIDDSGTPPVIPREPVRFKDAARIFATTLLDRPADEAMHGIGSSHAATPNHGCPPTCRYPCSEVKNKINTAEPNGPFDHKGLWNLKVNCCIRNRDDIVEAGRIMDDIGCDSTEMAMTFGVAMAAGILKLGDGGEMLRLLRNEIGTGTALGRVLGSGAVQLGRIYGIAPVQVIKDQDIQAQDPRVAKEGEQTCTMATTGADRTVPCALAAKVASAGDHVHALLSAGQIELARKLQIAAAVIDSAGMCLFIAFPALDIPVCLASLVDMINARFGISLTENDISALGKAVLRLERRFNLDAGLSRAHDRLPEFLSKETVPPNDVIWDFTSEDLDAYRSFQ